MRETSLCDNNKQEPKTMAKKYLLNIERIDDLVKEYITSVDEASYSLKIEKKPYLKKQYVISSNNETGYLNCHISKGRVSFDIQGKDSIAKEICEQCMQHIVKEATIPSPDRKCLTIRDVEETVWNSFVEEMKKESSYIVEERELSKEPSIVASYSITDQYGAMLYLQYYSTGTVYAQGAISTLFVAFQTYLIAFLSPAPDSVKDVFMSIENVEDDNFSNDLSQYFHHPEYIQGTVLETLVRTSFAIANSGCVMPDYGAMTYGIFKALEGLMYERLRKDLPKLDSFSCFRKDRTTKVISMTTQKFDSNPRLKAALLHGYEFYDNNRNATFHVDFPLITTRILDKDEAIGLIVDAIDRMNDICDNW